MCVCHSVQYITYIIGGYTRVSGASIATDTADTYTHLPVDYWMSHTTTNNMKNKQQNGGGAADKVEDVKAQNCSGN